MKILYAASEVFPYSKTGGLADVAGALPGALAAAGHQVVVFTPRYQAVDAEAHGLAQTGLRAAVEMGGEPLEGVFLEAATPAGVRVVFLENHGFFHRKGLYGGPDGYTGGDYGDNHLRFAFFSRAVLEYCRVSGFEPDVVHANDWQTALIPVYMKLMGGGAPMPAGARSLLTIHNLAYQGVFRRESLAACGLPQGFFSPGLMEFYGKVNFLKGGLVCADGLNAVSERYAAEIQTPEYGCGLEGVLKGRAASLWGITNGIDQEDWDPAADPCLAAPYSRDDLGGKEACRLDLLARLGLPAQPRLPVVGMVARLVEQKGLDLVEEVLDEILDLPLMLVVLGSGQKRYEDMLREAARRRPERVAVVIGFDEALARRIEAGADMFLMPSRYEPCGLNQMYSMRYGTVPVVRATGGLDDTVEHYDAGAGRGTGFVFQAYEGEALLACLREALAAFAEPRVWRAVMVNGMSRDFSWARAAEGYARIYRRLLESQPRRVKMPRA